MKTVLFYASTFGHTRRVAAKVATALITRPEVVNVRGVPCPEPYLKHDLWLFFCPTYGDEELQEEMEEFLMRIDFSLSGKLFAICELGAYYGYDDFSFGAMKILRRHLLELGASELCQPLSLDSFLEIHPGHLSQWTEHLNERIACRTRRRAEQTAAFVENA